jgi:hypothetical protein
MGGIVQSLFGGAKAKSQQTSESGNKAYDSLNNTLGAAPGYVTQGGNALAALLGLTGGGAQAGAQANFRGTPGYDFQMQEGQRAINSNMAQKGLLHSGAGVKASMRFGQGLADSTYQNYISNLLGLGNLGNSAAGTLAGAGQWSKGQETKTSSENTSNLGKALGMGISLLSDERMKKDIVKVGEHEGLSVYEYRYKWENEDDTVHVGVMAQEVAKKYPEAIGLPLFDYMRVDYALIPNWEDRNA